MSVIKLPNRSRTIRVRNLTSSPLRFTMHVEHGRPFRDADGNDKVSEPVHETLVLAPHEVAEVPAAWEPVLWSYQCSEPECRAASDKRCHREHDSRVVVGGQGATCTARADREAFPLSAMLAEHRAELDEAEESAKARLAKSHARRAAAQEKHAKLARGEKP